MLNVPPVADTPVTDSMDLIHTHKLQMIIFSGGKKVEAEVRQTSRTHRLL